MGLLSLFLCATFGNRVGVRPLLATRGEGSTSGVLYYDSGTSFKGFLFRPFPILLFGTTGWVLSTCLFYNGLGTFGRVFGVPVTTFMLLNVLNRLDGGVLGRLLAPARGVLFRVVFGCEGFLVHTGLCFVTLGASFAWFFTIYVVFYQPRSFLFTTFGFIGLHLAVTLNYFCCFD